MTAITRFLFAAPAERSPAAIFIWWEARRPAYNAIMAVSGVFALGLMAVVANLPPGSTELPPAPLVLLYGILANACYSLGPLAECALEMIWPRKLLPTGPTLFRMGLTFSIGLNFLAILIMGWDWVVRVLTWLL
jgi:hypothetical protein